MAFHVIGDQDTVLGYRFAGATGAVVESPEEAGAAFTAAIADKANRVLLITERIEAQLENEISQHRLAAAAPYIVVIQDVEGAREGRKSLQDLIYEAVGIRIVRDDSPDREP